MLVAHLTVAGWGIWGSQEHILEQDDGKNRWVQVVTELSRAFALCAASDSAMIAMGDDKLKVIAAELISKVKKSLTID